MTAKQRLTPIQYGRIPLTRDARYEKEFLQAFRTSVIGAENMALLPLGRGRSGIYLLVKYAVETTGRRRVWMSPYTIPDVVNMVILAGGTPAFFDHEPSSTRCDIGYLCEELDDTTACVLVTHYHVNELRTAALKDRCHHVGAFLFDDCALSYGGQIKGQSVGTLTDGSVFSFSSFKLLNFFWGGMIATGNFAIAQWVDKVVKVWPRLKLRDYAWQAGICFSYDIATRPAVFKSLVFPRLVREEAEARPGIRRVRMESLSLDSTLTSRPHFSAFAEWVSKIGKVDPWLRRRRQIAQIYHAHLSPYSTSGPFDDDDFSGGCFVNYALCVEPAARDAIALEMMRNGFHVGRGLYPNVHSMPNFNLCEGKSGNVGRLVASSLYLPTHQGVTVQYAEQIAQTLAKILTRPRSSRQS